MFKWSHILGTILLLTVCASAQELSVPASPRYVFEKVGDNIGLGTLTVTALAQDREGFIWIGTQSGLLRYDGSRTKHFSVEDGLASTVIDQIVVAPNGRMLVGTRKGASICHKDQFLKLPLPADAIPDPGYQFVAADTLGNIYLATRKGLYQYTFDSPTKSKAVAIQGGDPSRPIEAVYVAPDDTVWFASGRNLGIMRPKQRAEWLTVENQLPEEPVLALLKDGEGTLWIRTAKHVAHYDAATHSIIPEKASIPFANDFGMPTVDRAGSLLVPTVAGIYRRKGGAWEAVDRRRGMPVNATYAIMEDREGAYWVGLAGAGVVRWQGTSAWQAWTQAEGLPDNVIWAIKRDKKKRLWVGTNNGLAMWDAGEKRWRVWTASNGLNGSVVRDMAITPDGAIWVQSYPGGLTRFDPNTLVPQLIDTPKPEPSTLLVGPDGHLWIGSRAFLKELKDDRPPYRFVDVEVPAEVLGTVAHIQSAKGTLWAGGRAGISRFDGKQWTLYTAKDGLRPDIVTEIAAVDGDEVWFHYDEANGSARLRLVNGKPEVRHFTTSDGLPANETYMLGATQSGDVWSGGPLGLTLFPRKGTMQLFTRADGLIWDDLDSGGFYADEDGSIYFGTSGGLARYSPVQDQEHAYYRPPVAITSAILGGKEQVRETLVSVPHTENKLQIQFAALTFRDTDRVRCSYRLNGLENEANETTLREVRYPALPSGTYRFEVSCKSGIGIASNVATFEFTVAPAWWERWDVRTVLLALILLVIAAIIKLRTASLDRERLRLEQAVAERNLELAKANKELEEASLTDPLTGVRNRRFFDLIIAADVNQAVRSYSPPLASSGARNRDIVFYLIDIDHFKQINDDFGHAAGDKMLVEISRRICSVMRQTDVLIRWGGEEFLLISRAAERAEAMQLAARVLNAVGVDPYEIPGAKQPISRTCSVGWAPFPWFTDGPDVVSYEATLKAADKALYRAKDGGRNRAFGVVPSGSAADGDISAAKDNLNFEWMKLNGPSVGAYTGY